MAETALALSGRDMRVIGIDDPAVDVGRVIGAMNYDTFLAGAGDVPQFEIADEMMAISLSYTSGTTGNPKGVVYRTAGLPLMRLEM